MSLRGPTGPWQSPGRQAGRLLRRYTPRNDMTRLFSSLSARSAAWRLFRKQTQLCHSEGAERLKNLPGRKREILRSRWSLRMTQMAFSSLSACSKDGMGVCSVNKAIMSLRGPAGPWQSPGRQAGRLLRRFAPRNDMNIVIFILIGAQPRHLWRIHP